METTIEFLPIDNDSLGLIVNGEKTGITVYHPKVVINHTEKSAVIYDNDDWHAVWREVYSVNLESA